MEYMICAVIYFTVIMHELYDGVNYLVVTFRSPSLLFGYLEAYLGRLERWLRDWRIVISVSKNTAVLFVKTAICMQNPQQCSFSESQYSGSKPRYLGVTLDTQLTWSAHVNQVGKKATQRLGVLGPLLNRRSGLSVRSGVLLCIQLIRPTLNYAYPIRKSAARSHVRKLKVFQSKCLRIATSAPWYVSNRQIHEDSGTPFFADHIRALTESFDSKLADAGNLLVRELGRQLCRPRAS
jgi:hypothetical protein